MIITDDDNMKVTITRNIVERVMISASRYVVMKAKTCDQITAGQWNDLVKQTSRKDFKNLYNSIVRHV